MLAGPGQVWNAAVAAREGMPELVDITFSDECVSIEDRPGATPSAHVV